MAQDVTDGGPDAAVIRPHPRLTRSALDNPAANGQPGDGGHVHQVAGTRNTGGVMRLGRKISEGFAVDHEADRVADAQERPRPARTVEPEFTEWTPAAPQPAHSGSHED